MSEPARTINPANDGPARIDLGKAAPSRKLLLFEDPPAGLLAPRLTPFPAYDSDAEWKRLRIWRGVRMATDALAVLLFFGLAVVGLLGLTR